ncbi:DsrH/TusB family sulfur metabolism protein [Alishewanella sp. SMS8]|uniref:DsrH/TusB family sulfur metabolism protein n=1 Tax=Alishewanella sp. SMS8 TaxID=2994676 RepID=UPI002740BA60|nr:DsrH/TusB family sulfur metabolism protein [Alishewanella sp. SMS8]MDP4944547.1 DsrH/TusB family sulfur relay protein [Alishewanella sp.]MDP5034895.1 DsrH/TusB family sulfur relay protein [Alishewanella sp.]MDP5187809.1 DsrH/TusB family sulfur relay protein [Alishewanella sp.]MDP5457921.1 DsrH/TusB family sulfur metabolism protein [Alishewanella sp. SMS8]
MILFNLINPAADLTELAQLCTPADTVLLRQDAVYLVLQPSLPFTCRVLALSSDLAWRNLAKPAHIQLINTQEWVQLTAAANKSILWR